MEDAEPTTVALSGQLIRPGRLDGPLIERIRREARTTSASWRTDGYRLAADPRLLHDIADAMAALVPDDAEVLAGIELGGVPLVTALSAATGRPAAFLRRLPKRDGSGRQVEGASVEGRRVVLVDDVVRSGGQLLAMTRILRVLGAPVTDALCVWERPFGGRLLLNEHRVRLHPLLTEADPFTGQGTAP